MNGARGVIINVTGGPDLSLMEVNEASCIIQESAHEDANIIFGAVVDPELVGKVKITGHRHRLRPQVGARAGARRTSKTPVDMSRYQEHAQRVLAAASGGPVPVEAGGGAARRSAAGRRSKSRCATVDAGAKAIRAAAAGAGDDVDPLSQFDVPAFLRRN